MQPKNKDFKQLQGNLIFLFKQLERLNCDPNLRVCHVISRYKIYVQFNVCVIMSHDKKCPTMHQVHYQHANMIRSLMFVFKKFNVCVIMSHDKKCPTMHQVHYQHANMIRSVPPGSLSTFKHDKVTMDRTSGLVVQSIR